MLRGLRSRLTYANVVASIALFIALGGASYAAVKLPKNSVGGAQIKSSAVTGAKVKNSSLTGADIKNKSLTAADFKGSVQGPAGPQGATGAKGDPGATGASGAVAGRSVFSDAPTAITTSGEKTLLTLSVPAAGSYILNGKVTLENTSTTLAVLVDCFLRAGTDFDESRAELEANAATNDTNTATLPFTLAHTFASAGTATLTCNGFGAPLTPTDAKITGVQVQAIN